MDWTPILVGSAWAAVMAGAIAMFFTVPKDALWVAIIAGFLGRAARTIMVENDQSLIRATFVAALAVSLATVVLAPGRDLSPIVAMSALIPLGASINAFEVIWAALRIPGVADPAQRAELVTALIGNAVTVLAVTFTIAVGFVIPWLVIRLLHGEKP
jgi:uncharacterized membrane protein YjjB (DUF3815 family)